MKNKIKNILNLVKENRAFDFTGYHIPMLERRIQKRVNATNSENFDDYFKYLNHHHNEIESLIDVLTINVSCFFRNTLCFEYIENIIIPQLIYRKKQSGNNNLRIWSAGCSYGEEPYSMAIIINEFLKKEKISAKLNIFATDIDKKALKGASIGHYGFESVRNIKYFIFNNYFTKKDEQYKIKSEIKKMVQFSFFDLLDKKHYAPVESIFGGFDIILCRNVLIYFNQECQEIIFNKLYKSMNRDSYLILGEAEVPMGVFNNKFKRVSEIGKIYRKVVEENS